MNKMKKPLVAIGALGLGIIPALTACGTTGTNTATNQPAAQPEKVTIEFWNFWGSETRKPIIQKIIDDFNKSQDKIFVKNVYYPFGDVWTKELAAVAAGNPPDVIIQDINTVSVRADKKQATDLSKYLQKDNLQNRFFPNLWSAVAYKGASYGIPFNTDTRVLFWNKDLFKAAGLDPDKAPATWDELDADAKKLDKKNGDAYQTIGFYPLWNVGTDVWAANADGGKSYIDYSTGKPAINDPAKVDALNWINSYTKRLGKDQVNAFKASFGSKQANPFLAGKIAMVADTPTSVYTQIRDYGKDMKFGVAPLPEKTPGSGHWSWGGGFDVEIPYGAKHPDASWEFIKYLTDVSAQKYWAVKNFDNVANMEAAKQAQTDPSLDANGQLVYKTAVDNMQWTKLTPIPVNIADYLSLVNPQIDAATSLKTDPKTALDKAQADVEKLLQGQK